MTPCFLQELFRLHLFSSINPDDARGHGDQLSRKENSGPARLAHQILQSIFGHVALWAFVKILRKLAWVQLSSNPSTSDFKPHGRWTETLKRSQVVFPSASGHQVVPKGPQLRRQLSGSERGTRPGRRSRGSSSVKLIETIGTRDYRFRELW